MVGLVDKKQNNTIHGAQLHFRLFKLEPEGNKVKETLKAEMDARSVIIKKTFDEVHPGGIRHRHEVGEIGVYAARVEFDSLGDWGLEITGTLNSQPLPTFTPAFVVQQRTTTVPIGAPAPRSVQTILKDVKDVEEIDTSLVPNPDMHTTTIAEAVVSGKPTVIVFATPSFCVSRLCGPAKQAVDSLYEKYKGKANFIHVEPYDLEKAHSGGGLVVLPWLVQEWGLETEPWVFLVDRNGNIADKFEGIVTEEEIEAGLTTLLNTARQ